MAASHSPDAYHAYVLDLGGRNLSVLALFPHIAAGVNPDEEGYEERVADALRRHGLVARSLVSTMEEPSLKLLRARRPEIRLGWSVPRLQRDPLRNPIVAGSVRRLARLRARDATVPLGRYRSRNIALRHRCARGSRETAKTSRSAGAMPPISIR